MNLKAVSAIGYASVIASCGDDKEPKKKENGGEELKIGDTTLNSTQIGKLREIFGMSEKEEFTQDKLNEYLPNIPKDMVKN